MLYCAFVRRYDAVSDYSTRTVHVQYDIKYENNALRSR